MKFGALKFTSTNIGDEIQSIAAQRFLPQIDYYVFREQTHRFRSEEKIKLIMNSWYMWRPKNFPPNECIDPLLISMHFNPDCRKKILNKKNRSWFEEHGPVGCRDLSTLKWLDDNKIPAYFSGCLTSTLIANEKLREKYNQKYILCVSCQNEIVEYVRKKSPYPVYCIGKFYSPYIESIDRMALAKTMLFMFQNASCVITTNLHTAIPCLAFETPVCLIKNEVENSIAVGRFDGMEDYFHSCFVKEFVGGGV